MYQKKSGSWLKHSDFIILDILSLQLSMILAYVFRHGFANPYANSLYGRMALFLLLADFSTVFFWESFKNVLKRNKYTEFVATLRQVFIVILLSVLYLFSTKESGSGLGLTIARDILAEHDGKLELVSELGKGTITTCVFTR